MHRLLPLLLWLALPLGAAAQGRDSAFAVRKLFAQRRGNGEAIAATGASLIADITTPNAGPGGALLGAVPLVVGLRQAGRFSAERETAILARYAEGDPLPTDVRRQLRRKHFHRTARDLGQRR